MQTIKDWYLGGMVPAQDDAEFEKKHPRKGGKFAKKGEGGSSVFNYPNAAILQKTVAGLTDEQIENGIKNGELALKKNGLTDEQRVRYKHGLDFLRTEKANRAKKAGDGKGVNIKEGDIVAYVGKNVDGEKNKPLGVVVRIDDENGKKFYTADFDGHLSKVPASEIRAATKEETDSAFEATTALSEEVRSGEYARKQNALSSVMKELDEEIKEYKDSIERVKSGETRVFNKENWIKDSEKAIKQYEMVKDFINEHGALVKTEGAYSKRIDFLAKNADALGIEAVAPIVGGSRVGKFGTCFIGGNARHEHICKVLGLSCKKIGDGLFKVYVGDDAK